MRHYVFTATAFLLGAALMVWSAIPWAYGQNTFYMFIFFCGPSLVFSVVVVTLAILRYRRWQAVWLLLLSPFIYYGGGHVLFRDDIYGVVSPFIAALLTALVYLTASRMLIFQRCPWSIILKWVSLSLVAGIPFVYPVFKLGEDWLGNFWWWGLHILLWYAAVSYVLDKMANNVLPPTPVSGRSLVTGR